MIKIFCSCCIYHWYTITQVQSYDMPWCKNGDSDVCYKNDDTNINCDGYLTMENIDMPKQTLNWIKVGLKEYLVVKDLYDYERAKKFCTSICSELYSPANILVTDRDAVALKAWNNGVYLFYTGLVIEIKPGNVTFYSAYDNVHPISPDQLIAFRDYLFEARLGFTDLGTYPILIDTSSIRYNTFTISKFEEKHSFVCEGRPNINEKSNLSEYQGTLTLTIYLAILKMVTFVHFEIHFRIFPG